MPPPLSQKPVQRCLDSQKALVTGGSSGIGRAIAIMLGRAGADVCVNYSHGAERAAEVVGEIEKNGSKALSVRADVSNEEDVMAMFGAAIDHFKFLDIVVCNAGIQKDAPFDEMTVEQFDGVISINLKGQFICAREAVKLFRKQGIREGISCSAGKILSVSSVHDIILWAGHVNYAASKGGTAVMMKSIAQEVARHRIRVNIISPGAIRTPINTDAWKTREAYENLMRLVPYKRIGEPEDVGRCAVWLASDDSDYVNGATVYIDGGMTRIRALRLVVEFRSTIYPQIK